MRLPLAWCCRASVRRGGNKSFDFFPLICRAPFAALMLLLTRQSAEHGAVETQRNELPSFREPSVCPSSQFLIFPYIVALVHKKPYVDDYWSVRGFGEEPPRQPLTRGATNARGWGGSGGAT